MSMMIQSHLEKKKVVSHNSNLHKVKVKVTKLKSQEKLLNRIKNHSIKLQAKISYHRVSNKIKITIRRTACKNNQIKKNYRQQTRMWIEKK